MMNNREELQLMYPNIDIVDMRARILYPSDKMQSEQLLNLIESMGRICYRSKMSSTAEKRNEFIKGIVKKGHESVIEHANCSMVLDIPRSLSHQIVRHRVGIAYSQESQRYVDLSKEPLKVIAPIPELDEESFKIWAESVNEQANTYNSLRKHNVAPQCARSILPNCCHTKLGITANLRAWRHFMKERLVNGGADPAVREVMRQVFDRLYEAFPPVFEDYKAML